MKPTLQCPHGVDAPFGCAECARIERRTMAIPTVAMMAATFYTGPTTADEAAGMAWLLYEAVVRKI